MSRGNCSGEVSGGNCPEGKCPGPVDNATPCHCLATALFHTQIRGRITYALKFECISFRRGPLFGEGLRAQHQNEVVTVKKSKL